MTNRKSTLPVGGGEDTLTMVVNRASPGGAKLIEVTPVSQIYRESVYLLQAYNRMLRSHARDYLVIFIGILTQVAFYIQFPLVIKYILDKVIPHQDFTKLGVAAVEIVVLLGIGWAGSCVQTRRMARVGGRVLSKLRADMVAKLNALPLSFYSNVQQVDLLTRFSSDGERVENSMTRALPFLVESTLVTLGCLITIAFIDWHLALVATVLLPVGFLSNIVLGPREAVTNSESRRLKNSMLASVEVFLDSWLMIRAFGERKHFRSRFDRDNEQYTDASADFSYYVNIMPVFSEYAVNGSLAMIVMVGAIIAMEGGITTGAFVGSFALLRKVADGSAKTARYFSAFHNAIRPLKRIQALLAEPEIGIDSPRAVPISSLSREIAFENVSAGYAPGQEVVKNLNVVLKAGSSVAFVGPSGSGKSTILKLLMRIIEPQSGVIKVDGIDFREAQMDAIRSRSGIVLQDSHVFQGTVAENLRMGKPEATNEEIMAAAVRAQCHDWIVQLPKGYDQPIDEKGTVLSGGQRQRIAVARAFVHGSMILMLDEPTSMLDPITEDSVNAAIREAGKGRTVIMCTHRLALSRNFDRIVVVEKGSIVEQGSHDELIAANGLYRRLWEKQHGFVSNSEGFTITPERLRAIPIFASLGLDTLEDLASEFVTETYEPGMTIIKQGASGDRFYVAVRGLVDVLIATANGGERKVAELGSGDHFGEVALLRAVPRTATVRASAHTTCLSLARARFLRLVNTHPGLLAALEKAMEARK